MAHSQLISSSPAEGAVLPRHPATVTLTFNENINPAFVQIRVKDAQGAGSDLSAQVKGPAVTASMIDVPAGRTTVMYRVTSADGHPISGEIHYTASTGATTPATKTMSASATSAAPVSAPATPAAQPSPLPWYLGGGAVAAVLVGVGAWGLRGPRQPTR